MLNHGLSILLLIIAGAVAAGFEIGKKKDTYLLLVMVIIAMHTTFDPQLMWAGYDSFIMLYSYFKLREDNRQQFITNSEADKQTVV